MKIKVRKLKLADSLKLDELFTKLILFEKRFSNNIIDNISIHGSYQEIIADSKSLILVAENDSELIGFIYIYEKQLDEIFISKEAFIEAMFVLETYRNQGIGYLLFKEAIKWSKKRNISIIDVDVMCYNIDAVDAYKKYGFKEIKKGMRIIL